MDPKAIKVRDLHQDYLTTNCVFLDKILKGGIPTFGITEIAGESSTGKTQLCLQLALTSQLPKRLKGLESGAFYISTDRIFPSKRLEELSKHFKNKYGDEVEENPMDNVIIEHLGDVTSLLDCLEVRFPSYLESSKKKIKVVILDSIASVFRGDYDCNDEKALKERTSLMRKVGLALHNISFKFNAAVVVANQMTSSLSLGEDIPSLGLTWMNFVTTRLLLKREFESTSRTLRVLFSPHIPVHEMEFEIHSEGVQGKIF